MSAARHCSGFTLVSAIFLLVGLAALGIYMVTISGVQHTTNSHAVIAARTYYAAKSGLEWAVHRAVNTQNAGGGATAIPIACGIPPATATYTFTDASLGNNITITTTCTYSRHADSKAGATKAKNSPFNVAVVTSTAEYGVFGSPDYARRRLEATVSNANGPKE